MSVTNFNPQTVKDIAFVKGILPDTYKVGESKKLGSIHCVSKTGIVKPPYITNEGRLITDAEDTDKWQVIMFKLESHFGERFQEVYHNTCYCHVDFTIYLKSN